MRRSRACVICRRRSRRARRARRHESTPSPTVPSRRRRLPDHRRGTAVVRRWLVLRGPRRRTPVGPRSSFPPRGSTTRRNATAALVTAVAARCAPVDAAVRALGRFGGVARRFEFRGEVDGITFVDDYAHLPDRGGRDDRRGAATGTGSGSSACSSPTATAAPLRCGATSRDAFARADQVVLTDIYAAGETPRPGVTGKLVVDAVLDAHPWSSVAYLPRLDDVAGWLTARLRPGDLCLTLGAGDLTGVPDTVIERRKVRRVMTVNGPRRGRWNAFDRARWPAEPASTNRSAHSPPTGWGEPRRHWSPSRSRARTSTSLVAALGDGDGLVPVVAIGRGSNLLVADEGFDGVAVVLGAGFADASRWRKRSSTPGAAAKLPVVARASVQAGLAGFEWAVGVPGSDRRSAVRMNAGGHGAEMIDSLEAVEGRRPRRRLGRGGAMRPTRSISPYRHSNLASRPTWWWRPGWRLTPRRRRDRGRAEMAEIVQWRQPPTSPAGRTPARCSPTPRATAPGRLIDTAGGKGLRIGTAEVSTKHANFIQADEDGRSADVLAVMEEVQRLVADVHGVELHPETHLVGFDDLTDRLPEGDTP